jgi:hypothetical protein
MAGHRFDSARPGYTALRRPFAFKRHVRIPRADLRATDSSIDNAIYRLLAAHQKRLFKTGIRYISKMARNLPSHVTRIGIFIIIENGHPLPNAILLPSGFGSTLDPVSQVFYTVS